MNNVHRTLIVDQTEREEREREREREKERGKEGLDLSLENLES